MSKDVSGAGGAEVLPDRLEGTETKKKSPAETSVRDMCSQEVVDDYTFECEVGGQAQRTKVSIFQSMGDPLVYGKIYCTKEPKAEEDSTDLKLIHPP